MKQVYKEIYHKRYINLFKSFRNKLNITVRCYTYITLENPIVEQLYTNILTSITEEVVNNAHKRHI